MAEQVIASGALPLTGPGGEFEVPPGQRDHICLLSDGTLLVSKSHSFNPLVRGFISRLQRLEYQFRMLMVDIPTITAAYASTRSRKIASSDMMEVAQDLFHNATRLRASDIHIRVSERAGTKIYFRVNNRLEFFTEQSYEHGVQLCTAIYQSMADISDATFEQMSKQDARISDRDKMPEGVDGIRIASSPMVGGICMVLRLLYADLDASLDLRDLGYTDRQAKDIDALKKVPHGINILGGPTGSGKSTTLQRTLRAKIRDAECTENVITVEDPPEYPIENAVQTGVTDADNEEERSKAFQASIRSAMRQDPDVIMIGEVRDFPSAQLAIRAAITGHQVWTTLHANDAFSIMTRLLDLGLSPAFVGDHTIIRGVICQRLVRVLCPCCKKPLSEVQHHYPPEDVQRILNAVQKPADQIYVQGEGCDKCRKSGAIGRSVVAEIIVTDREMMRLVREGEKEAAKHYWRKHMNGFSMVDHAITKVRNGNVCPFEAEGVVGEFILEDDSEPVARQTAKILPLEA